MEKRSTAPIIAGVLILVVAVGGVVWAMNRNDDDTAKTTSSAQSEMTPTPAPTPAPKADIVGLASGTADLSTLVSAVKAADLVSTLQGSGPFTVFAPTNEAFNALPAGTLDTLLKPENKDQLKSILTYHVVPGKIMAADLKDGQQVTTVQGKALTVKLKDGKAYLVDATGAQAMVTQADVAASNGVVHIIDKVVLPQ